MLLPPCLSVLSEYVASQSKWQSADLDPLKLPKNRKSVWPALFRFSVIKFLTSLPVYSRIESEPKHEVATIERYTQR